MQPWIFPKIMTIIKFCNKKICFGNLVFYLILFAAFLDVVFFSDARASKELFSSIRVFPQAVKLVSLGLMVMYVFIAYRRPENTALRLLEFALWLLVLLITLNLFRINSLYQLACAARAYYWIFAYFFFRLTVNTVSNLQFKVLILSLLIILLGVQMHWAAVSWTELRHQGQTEAFSSNAALCLQFVFLLTLCFYRFTAQTLIVFVFCASLVVFSLKRSIIISTGLSIGLLAAAYFRLYKIRTAGAITVLMLMIFLPTFVLHYSPVKSRFQHVASPGNSQRWWRYLESYNHWIEANLARRIFGHGFYETSFHLQDIYYSRNPAAEPIPLHSHSDFFQILPDLGLLGLAHLLMMHFAFWFILWKLWKRRSRLLPAMLVFYCFYVFISFFNGAMARYETLYLMLPLAALCHEMESELQQQQCICNDNAHEKVLY